jgi:hypothetical protein
MFEASLLVCLTVSPETCTQLNDTRGPYASKNECEQRVDEMAEFAVAANLFELDIKWKCTETSELKVRFYESPTPDSQKKGLDSTTGTVPRVAI